MTTPQLVALSVATAATSMGGYADPPMIWKTICQHPVVQVGALGILVWQAGRQNVLQALMIALVFYLVVMVVKMYDEPLMALYKKYVAAPVQKFDATNSIHYSNPRWTVG